jgi:hypothetical protein
MKYFIEENFMVNSVKKPFLHPGWLGKKHSLWYPHNGTMKQRVQHLITPVLKKGKDPTTPGNYRGITVTRSFSKILECIIKSRIDPILRN